jgi:N-acetylglucosamine kinase-like BadF-type ATPase
MEMHRMQCVLAVDGGNTKTVALVASLDGEILGAALGGCSDIYNAEPDAVSPDAVSAALANAERTIMAALREAGATATDIATSVFNMAGADWPEDLAFWRAAADTRGLGRTIIVQNDALGVLYVASPDATGVSIVLGTGAATGARAPDGRVWHSSFWQDEVHGSNHLGQKLLFAVYRSELGIEPPTTLKPRVLEYYGVESVEEVLHLFHDRRHPAPSGVDRLAPILLDEAHAGDGVALRVVREHGAALGDIALAAARWVGLEGTPFPLVLAGGVFRHPTTVLEDAIVARMHSTSPDMRSMRSPAEPVAGVLIQALGAAGTHVDSALLDRLISSIPATILLTTSRV